MAARVGPRAAVGPRIIDERSMDGTALLAFGILLEEASREVLGKRGDLVFTEGSDTALYPLPQNEEHDSRDPLTTDKRLPKRRKMTAGDYVEEPGA